MLLLWWIYGTQHKEIYCILIVYIFGYYRELLETPRDKWQYDTARNIDRIVLLFLEYDGIHQLELSPTYLIFQTSLCKKCQTLSSAVPYHLFYTTCWRLSKAISSKSLIPSPISSRISNFTLQTISNSAVHSSASPIYTARWRQSKSGSVFIQPRFSMFFLIYLAVLVSFKLNR
jgi:hypothetical protein